MAEQDVPARNEGIEVSRHEERLRLDKETRETGRARARKWVETEQATQAIPRAIEEAELERAEPNPNDSGEVETLPDGSVSIPVLEEELVVTKRLVVRERVILRKRTRTEMAQVETELRKERLEIEADPGVLETETPGPGRANAG